MNIDTICPSCKDEKTFEVTEEQFQRFQTREHVQDIFSELRNDDRERLITGICPKCWDEIFEDEDEDEDDE